MEEETTRLLVGSQATLGKAVHDRKVLEIHNRFLPLVPIGAIIGARVPTMQSRVLADGVSPVRMGCAGSVARGWDCFLSHVAHGCRSFVSDAAHRRAPH